MGIGELFVLAVGLSMDAFAVSVCKGLSLGCIRPKHMGLAGLWFGGFQALMPLIGYFLGRFFTDSITRYSHWIAFVLLLFIGINMIREALGEEEKLDAAMDAKSMLLLAIATSIDALAVGVTFAFLQVDILAAVSYRCDHLCRLCRGNKDRQYFRLQVQIQGRNLRRDHSDFYRLKDSFRGNWNFVRFCLHFPTVSVQ